VMPEIDPQPSDIVLERLHGMTPFTSTPTPSPAEKPTASGRRCWPTSKAGA